MNFLKSIGSIEYSLIFCFIIIYAIYIFRLVKIGKQVEIEIKRVIFKFINVAVRNSCRSKSINFIHLILNLYHFIMYYYYILALYIVF